MRSQHPSRPPRAATTLVLQLSDNNISCFPPTGQSRWLKTTAARRQQPPALHMIVRFIAFGKFIVASVAAGGKGNWDLGLGTRVQVHLAPIGRRLFKAKLASKNKNTNTNKNEERNSAGKVMRAERAICHPALPPASTSPRLRGLRTAPEAD